MTALQLIALINAIANALPALSALVAQGKEVWSSDDLASVEAAMNGLKGQAETDFARVDAELLAASQT